MDGLSITSIVSAVSAGGAVIAVISTATRMGRKIGEQTEQLICNTLEIQNLRKSVESHIGDIARLQAAQEHEVKRLDRVETRVNELKDSL